LNGNFPVIGLERDLVHQLELAGLSLPLLLLPHPFLLLPDELALLVDLAVREQLLHEGEQDCFEGVVSEERSNDLILEEALQVFEPSLALHHELVHVKHSFVSREPSLNYHRFEVFPPLFFRVARASFWRF